MRKALIMAVALLLAMAATAQVKFTVRGTTHPGSKQVTLGNLASGQGETVGVTDGKFTAQSEAPQDAVMAISDQEHQLIGFFIADAADITIDLQTDVITGSPLNERLSAIMQQMGNLNDGDGQLEFLLTNIQANKDNPIAALLLYEACDALPYQTLQQLLGSGEPFASHPLTQRPRRVLESKSARLPGTPYKDLQANDPAGQPHQLSEFVGQGNYVLIDFWASWCGPCRQEMPNVVAAFEKYHAKGFNVVGLSLDQNADAWKKAIRDLNMNWTHLSDLKGWRSVAAKTYGINSIPASILLDPDGRIVATDLRGSALAAKLKDIYGE